MNIFRRDCQCGRTRFFAAKSSWTMASCDCGAALTMVREGFHFQSPSRPVRRVTFPVVDFGPKGPFGRLHFDREIVGARTANGQTEILCRYGTVEKWYPVAA